MAHTASDYKYLTARLLPSGVAWLASDPRVARLLAGLGVVGARQESEIIVPFDRDAVPSKCLGDRLAAWELALALPDLDYPTVTTDAERQAAVVRVLSQGGTPTLAALEACADVWSLTATATEYADFPCEVWLYGPVAHVKAFRVGSSTVSGPLLWQSETWQRVMRLVARLRQAHVLIHTADAV